MKSSKIISLALTVSLILISMTSCNLISNLFHKHSWQDFLAKEPTCTEVGLLKKVCLECGEIEYTEINMSNHVFVNDICTYCGGHKDTLSKIQRVSLPYGSTNTGMRSMRKIYDIACELVYDNTYEAFINQLSHGSLKNASIDSLGNLRITAMYISNSGNSNEIPLTLTYESVSPLNPGTSLGTIWSAYIQNKTLILTYANGKEIIAGTFDSNESAYIIGFGINTAKELVIYYSDNTIGFGGKISG